MLMISEIRFDMSIALGSIIHLVALILFLAIVSWRASKRLARIEKKQDALLENLKPK